MRSLAHELDGVKTSPIRKMDGAMANLPCKHRLGWPSS